MDCNNMMIVTISASGFIIDPWLAHISTFYRSTECLGFLWYFYQLFCVDACVLVNITKIKIGGVYQPASRLAVVEGDCGVS
jgi:hypothetical protein